MATSDHLMSGSDLQTSLQLQDHDQQYPIRRSSARRKTKGGGGGESKKLKQPRRGMGVAKLERLRLQDMTEADQPGFPHPVLEMNPSSAHAYAAFTHMRSPVGYYGLSGSEVHHRLLQHHEPDFFGLNSETISGNAVKCYSPHCNTCHKKKKIKGDRRFLGLGLEENQNIVNHGRDLGGGAKGNNYGNKVGVVAMHRKGSSRDGGVIMEYDFFSSGNMEGGGGGEAGMVQSSSRAGFDASNCVDLSLKLSSY